MARGKKTPQDLVDELDAQRMALAIERDEARRQVLAAYVALQVPERGPNITGAGEVHRPREGVLALPERRRAAQEAETLGRDHESLEAIAAEEAEAVRALQVDAPRVAVLEGAMETLKGDIERIEDENIEWFARRAHELSAAAVDAHGVAREAIQAAMQARREAVGEWSRVRLARRRLGLPPLAEVPLDDGAAVLNAFDNAGRWEPWPGGKRPMDEQVSMAWRPGEWNQRWESSRRTSLTEPEVRRSMGEPVIEQLG